MILPRGTAIHVHRRPTVVGGVSTHLHGFEATVDYDLGDCVRVWTGGPFGKFRHVQYDWITVRNDQKHLSPSLAREARAWARNRNNGGEKHGD